MNQSKDPFNCLNYPHFLIPSLNCSVEFIRRSKILKNYVTEYTPMSYSCSLPVPSGVPATLTERSMRGTDHVTKLVNDKHIWEINKEELISKSVKFKDNKIYSTRLKNYKLLPMGTLQLAEHLKLDPDPKFSGFYNWYYSDGCLNNIFHNNTYSVLHVYDNLPGSCFVTPVNIETTEFSLLNDSTMFLETGHKKHIFQISVNNNFVAVRQKNFTTLFTVIDDQKLKFRKIHNHSESKDSIVSVSVSNDLDGEYCSLTTSRKLKLWSPQVKDECISCVKIKKSKASDRWGSVKYVSNNIMVSTRSNIYLKDQRMNLEKNAQKWSIKTREKPCEFITLTVTSKSNDYEYVGTTHSLFELDFRNGFSKRWTHMMELPPMYGTVNSSSDNGELVFIGSQNLNEICAIDASHQVMPYMLSSPDETRTKVNMKGLCLEPTVSSRFCLSMIGMTSIPDHSRNDSYFILRSNSVGDIFYQRIQKDEPSDFIDDSNTIDFEAVSDWENTCVKSVSSFQNTPLKVTSVVNFSELKKYLEGETYTGKNSKRRKKSKVIPWVPPKYRTLDAHDSFTQSFKDIWDVGDLRADESATDMSLNDEQCSQNISGLGVSQNDSEFDLTNETIPSSRGLQLNESNIVCKDPVPVDMETMRGGDVLHFEEYDMYHGGCSTTPNKVIQNKSGKIGAKSKSRFSSGF